MLLQRQEYGAIKQSRHCPQLWGDAFVFSERLSGLANQCWHEKTTLMIVSVVYQNQKSMQFSQFALGSIPHRVVRGQSYLPP